MLEEAWEGLLRRQCLAKGKGGCDPRKENGLGGKVKNPGTWKKEPIQRRATATGVKKEVSKRQKGGKLN